MNQRSEFYLYNTVNLRPLNSTHYATLYPQNGDRIVATDSVTSFHPIHIRGAAGDSELHIAYCDGFNNGR